MHLVSLAIHLVHSSITHKLKAAEKQKLVRIFLRAVETSIPVFCSQGQRSGGCPYNMLALS